MLKGHGTEDWFSGAFGHGLPSDYVIVKRALSDDELVEAGVGSRWLEDLKEGATTHTSMMVWRMLVISFLLVTMSKITPQLK